MRIAFFTNNYLPNPYGVAGSVESFRKEFERQGHEAYIFAPEWEGYADSNPRVFRFPAVDFKLKIKFPIAIPYSGKMDEILERLDLDIIHSQHPNLLGSAARKWAKKKKIPLVFTWHTLYDQYAHYAPFVPKKFAAWWLVRNARKYANRCDAVITPTPSVAEIIRKWGVHNKYIFSIPTGVEEAEFQKPDRNIIRKKYNISGGEIILFVMTRLTEEKNVGFLIDAAIPILEKNPRAKFMICGDGNLKQGFQEKVARSGIGKQVIFVGIVSDAEKKNYYSAGDIFVYASKSETQGMVLTEAMYSGLPIVAVRATGVKDIVEDGPLRQGSSEARKTGFLVSENKEEFAGAVQKLIDNENMRKGFGEEAKRVAREKYTSRICAEKILEVYRHLLVKG